MLLLQYNKLKSAAILYAAVPLAIFFFGWFNLPAALLCTLLLAAAVFFYFRQRTPEDGEYTGIPISWKLLAAVIVTAFLWCLVGGQGGFAHQTDDQEIRNRIMCDLTLKEWPVVYHEGKDLLCYYIAYWMVPCGAGKIAHLLGASDVTSMYVCNTVILIWSTIGVTITLLLVIAITQKKGKSFPVLAVVIFIFFSGMDCIGFLFQNEEWKESCLRIDHIEWWAPFFQFSSNTTLLFWVYNQTIPVWPLILCMINDKNAKDMGLVGLLAFPYGPFPFVGMVAFGLLRADILITRAVTDKRLGEELRSTLTPQNFLAVFAIVPALVLYFHSNVMVSSGNSSGINTGLRLLDYFHDPDPEVRVWLWWVYPLFILLECGIMIILLLIKKKKTALTLGVAAYLMVTPLLQLGTSRDFGMRVSIPGLVYLCIMMIRLVVDEMPEKGEIKSLDDMARKRTVLLITCFVLAIGAATPVMEITREVMYTVRIIYPDPSLEEMWEHFDYDNMRSLEEQSGDGNFFARNYQQSTYYRYISKH